MTTRVKICGITDAAALDAALEAGADYVGLVFFAKSPRNLDVAAARELARRARRQGAAEVVALLVDPDDAAIAQILDEVAPDILQLHGHEPPIRVAEIAHRAQRAAWKAVPVATVDDVAKAHAYLSAGEAERLLFDAKPPADPAALPGGNGLSFDWRLLEDEKGGPFVLAGGLTADNVAAAVRLLDPYAVDVSSGVETAPGRKSPALIRDFIRAAKGAK